MRKSFIILSALLALASCDNNNVPQQENGQAAVEQEAVEQGETSEEATDATSAATAIASGEAPTDKFGPRTIENIQYIADQIEEDIDVKMGSIEIIDLRKNSPSIVKFTELIHDEDDNVTLLDPVKFEFDHHQCRFIIYNPELGDGPFGNEEVPFFKAKSHFNNVMIYVGKEKNNEYPLIHMMVESIAD